MVLVPYDAEDTCLKNHSLGPEPDEKGHSAIALQGSTDSASTGPSEEEDVAATLGHRDHHHCGGTDSRTDGRHSISSNRRHNATHGTIDDAATAAKDGKLTSCLSAVAAAEAAAPSTARAAPLTFPEGGLTAWLVVLGSFCAMFSVFGIINMAAVFESWFATHQLAAYDASQIGWVFSLYLFIVFFVGIQVGPLFDRRGPRLLVAIGSLLLVASLLLLGFCTGKSARDTGSGLLRETDSTRDETMTVSSSLPPAFVVVDRAYADMLCACRVLPDLALLLRLGRLRRSAAQHAGVRSNCALL